MATSTPSIGRWCIIFVQSFFLFHSNCCSAYLAPTHLSALKSTSHTSVNNRRPSFSLGVSTIDVEVPRNDRDVDAFSASLSLLSLKWSDAIDVSIHTAVCVVVAIIISTYEDFDVTHTRPNPSSLRPPTSSRTVGSSSSPWEDNFNFLGAATKGLGWGPSDRGAQATTTDNFFEEWYGTSATTLQWKPSYNEIMLQHRLERVPRWNELDDESRYTVSTTSTSMSPSKEQTQQAVLQLYQSLDELDQLKTMADDYAWDDMKAVLNPTSNIVTQATQNKYTLQSALEYSMDILRYTNNDQINLNSPNSDSELHSIVGLDWGSCAWRHCGAKADAQESIAELYSNVGMLEPFECRFIIDIVERSVRDVLAIVPDDLKPLQDGAPMQAKPYVPYVSQAIANGDEGMGLDYEYVQALSEMRVDLSGDLNMDN